MHRLPTDGPLRRALRPSGPVRFHLSERQQPGATMVHVDGELDILTAPKLGAQLDGIVRKAPAMWSSTCAMPYSSIPRDCTSC